MSEDSEIGQAFRAMKEASQEKKRSNLEWSTQKLQELGVPFESKNYGVHLIVSGKSGLIDFWPSTGKYIQRKPKKQGRGIKNLLKLCEVTQ